LTQYALSEEQDRQRAKQEARARVLKDFERGLGLGTPGSGSVSAVKKDDKVELKSGQDAADLARGTKRKFEFDQGAVERLAQEAEDAAMAEMEAEQVSQGSVARTPCGNSSLTGLFSLP
jgi:nitric oxide synthase-interacting protein